MIERLEKFTLNSKEAKQWLFTFLSLCLCLSPLILNFIWGNHDWNPILNENNIKSGLIEGRFSQFLFLRILTIGQILPILNLVFGLAAYSLALILLYNRYFEFSHNLKTILLLITSATLPYIIEIIYFQFIALSQLTWPLIITLSLLAIKKSTEDNKHKIPLIILGTILLLLAIGGYPASAGLFATAPCLLLLKQKKLSFFSKYFITTYLPYAISLIIAFSCLCIIYQWLLSNNIMINLYNNQSSSPEQIIKKIFPTIQIAIQSFLQPLPFLNLYFKLISFTIFTLYICQKLAYSKNIIQKINILILVIILLLAIKLPTLLSQQSSDNYFDKYDPISFMLRTDFYTMPCVILFCSTTLCLHKSKLISNLSFILVSLLLQQNILANYNFSKIHLLGFSAENKLQQRINARIQEQADYDPKQIYAVIQAGELPHRPKYYIPSPLEKYGYYTLNIPYTRYWITEEYYNFYEPTPFAGPTSTISITDITPKMVDFFSQKIEVWPNENALYIDKKFIIIALTQQGKDMLIQQFHKTRSHQP